ncbi:WD_REPEATS_REGION domain-containing protein, partial [Haematococcus lacustris]
ALAGAGPSLGLGHQRKPSVGKAPGGGMSPSLHSLDMNVVQPSMQHRLHLEPTCDIAFTEHFVVTADHTGCVRTWERPASLQRVSMTLRAAMQAATAGSPG